MTAQRYDTVLVHEPGIDPWQGIVMTIKPPVPESRKGKKLDQWADVRREDGIEFMVPLPYLEVLEHRAFGIAAPAPIIAGIEAADEAINEVLDDILDEGRTGAPDDSRFTS